MIAIDSRSKRHSHQATLSTQWYVDPAFHQIEQDFIFRHSPLYVGHQLMVPSVGDFHTLEWMGNAQMLMHDNQGIHLLSNVCRHRQALLLEGRGNTAQIVCPVHKWAYLPNGQLRATPQLPVSQLPNTCLDLDRTPLTNWRGLLFAQGDPTRDLADLLPQIDFSDYVFDRTVIEECPCNWKTFLEIYLEVYHIGPCHAGLRQFVDYPAIEWQLGTHFSVQTVMPRASIQPSTHSSIQPSIQPIENPLYQRWLDLLQQHRGGRSPDFGAIWIMYYPNIMIECYPEALVISTVIPRSPSQCTNVIEFYFPQAVLTHTPELVDAFRAVYAQTAQEDDAICRRITAGRQALYAQGIDDAGPCQSPLEDGIPHFHAYLQQRLSTVR